MPADDLRDVVGASWAGRRTTSPSWWPSSRSPTPSSTRPRSATRPPTGSSTRSPRSGCRTSRCRRRRTAARPCTATRPAPTGAPTVLLYCHYDVQPPLGEDAWTVADLGADRARRPLVRARLGRLQGQHRHAPHRAARAPAANGGFPCGIKLICEGSEEQGTGGLEEFVPENADLLRADTILVVDTGNFAVGVPTLTSTLRGMTSVDVTLRGLDSAMHSGMFGGPAPTRCVGLIQMLASLHDEHGNTTDRRARRDADLDRHRLPGRAVPQGRQRARRRRADGRRHRRRPAVGAASATVIGIDVPHVIGSAAAVQASAAARVSLRLPPGIDRPGGAGRARRAPARRACRGACSARSSASRSATRSSARSTGPAFEALKAAMEEAFGRADDDRGPGRLDPAVQRARRDLPRRGDLPHGRRGAEVPDPRAQRERRPVARSSTSRSPRRCSSRTTRGRAMTRPFTAEDFARPDRARRDAGGGRRA